MVEDGIGNQDRSDFGPFYVEQYTGTLVSALETLTHAPVATAATFTQSIIVDGHIDIAHGEWHPETERLDVDPRFSNAHALYTTWDDQDLFLGWTGAIWSLHGDAWLYFDSKPGGTTQAIHASALTLPMEADYAIQISSSTEGTLWRFDGGWQEVSDSGFEFAHRARRRYGDPGATVYTGNQ